jgi:2-dehydro-3-deoxy-D-arabinonate dehydratase
VKLYRTTTGCYVEQGIQACALESAWDDLVRRDDLYSFCASTLEEGASHVILAPETFLAPIESQEVWAAGVTYYRSRSARMDESKDAGGGTFYDRVYQAERPEIFFKATGRRVVGPGGKVQIRKDASWSVPEPELTLLISPSGKILGYTIGNDMSSRDIEGENPLYLPQAKVYNGSCALGPCIYLTDQPIPRETLIEIKIIRGGQMAFAGSVALTELKRNLETLVSYLYRDNSFPDGCFLMTGTGIVPPDSFTLASGDQVQITIEPIGTLANEVA